MASSSIVSSDAVAARGADRDAGLDALRASLALLVVFHHAALTYGAIGGWYYREVPTDGRLETKLLILFCTINQAFFMGLFFLIAGYLTPRAVARHGAGRYARERAVRLGVPLMVYGFLIGPMTIALAETARGRPFLATLVRYWQTHLFESGPLWFAQALLIFAACFLGWRWMSGWFRRTVAATTRRPFPSNTAMTLAMLVTGTVAFALRLKWPIGTNVLGLQVGYFASYAVLFAAGCAGSGSRWLEDVPARQRKIWLVIAAVACPVLPAVVLLAPMMPVLRGETSGGWNIQAVVYAFWEPLLAWGVILGLLSFYNRHFQRLGPVWASLARRAYGIFIIHPPVLVAVALAWRDVAAPHGVKFAVTGGASCLVCFVLAGLLTRVTAVRRVI